MSGKSPFNWRKKLCNVVIHVNVQVSVFEVCDMHTVQCRISKCMKYICLCSAGCIANQFVGPQLKSLSHTLK